MKWAARGLLVSLAVSAFWMLAVPVSHADPVQTLDCRDATAAELAGRSGGTTCSWTMPTPTVTACASFEVLATGPYVMGGDGPDSSSSVAASLMRWTVFHPATTFAEGHRLDVQVRCSESSVTGVTLSVPYALPYAVGRCDSAGVCTAEAAQPARVEVTNTGPMPVAVQSSVPLSANVAVQNFPAPEPHPTSFAITGPVSVNAPEPLPVREQNPVGPSSTTVTCGGTASPSPSPSPTPTSAGEPSPSPTSGPSSEDGCMVRVADEQYLMGGIFAATFLVLALTAFVKREAVGLTR